MKLNQYQLITAGLLSLTICSGLVLTSTKSYADNDSATDDVNITVPVACTMSGNIATGQEHTATLSPGTYSAASGSDYENGIGTTTLTTFCNDNNGFSIYAIGYTDNTYGDNTLVGANTGSTIATKAYESTDTTSNWSMKVDKVTDTTTSYNPANMTIDNSFNSYHAVPSEYTRVAHYQASTGPSTTDTTLGAKLTTTYAAFISQTQPADTYQGQVKYVMVHPYMQDDSNKPTTSMTINDLTYMQDFATLTSAQKAQVLASMTSEQQYQLQDSRDHKNYYISKLADGNVWMTQNLDHDIKNDGTVTYDNTTTDLGWNTSTNSYDTASWTPVASTHASNDTEWNEYDEDTNPDGGDIYHTESYDPGNMYWNGTITDDDGHNQIATTGDAHYHLGNYYNWTAAVAMSDSSNYEDDGTDVDQSICPAGWMLPKYSGNDSFYNLINGRYTSGTSGNIHLSPAYFAYGGDFDGDLRVVGYGGYHWSSVVSSEEDAYGLFFRANGSLNPQDYYWRYYGLSVRCLAR